MNKHLFRSLILACLISLAFLLPPQTSGTDKEDLRPSILAGRWYPQSQDALAQTIQRLLSRVKTPILDGELKAIIVPHAGYSYSGYVAAHAYKLLSKKQFRRVILIGPSHRTGFRGVSVNLQAGYETPLGIVPVDQEMARKILNTGPNIRWLRKAHAFEHSLEIQLPFLQTVLHNFKIVPIIMGQQDFETCLSLANTLVQVLKDTKDTLLLASSDLSHYHPYNKANTLDHQFIKDLQRFDPQGLSKDLILGKCEACGGGPVITTLLASKAIGADQAIILNHANSGDITGDHSQVVGYLSAALIKSSDTGPHPK